MGYTTDVSSTLNVSVTETVDGTTSPASPSSGASRTYSNYNRQQTLRSTSTPTPFRAIDESIDSLAGTDTIDLTAAKLAENVDRTVDLTGKKLITLVLVTDPENAGSVTIKPAAVNGYNLFGNADGEVTLGPGKRLVMDMDSGSAIDSPAVAAGAKDITITGTATDVLTFFAVFGT